MNYYNESDIPNHKEIKIIHLKNNRNKKFYSSTDNIFQFNKGNNLHKIYNNFLINPYIERRKQYQNVNNVNKEKAQNLKYKIRHFDNKNLNDIKEFSNNIRRNKYLRDSNINYSENNSFLNYNKKNYYEPLQQINKFNYNQNYYLGYFKNGKNLRKKIIKVENKNELFYRNNSQIGIGPSLSESNYQPHYPKINKIENFNNSMIIERPIEYNIKNENNYNNYFYTNNNDKLYLSYDIKKRNNNLNKSISYDVENEYISPVIAKIAKRNYLMKNPYSEKSENLGPTKLINNPILYPISTYKYDFDRYLKDNYLNKFV